MTLNKGLQLYHLKNWFRHHRRPGFDLQKIDFKSEVDSEISYRANKRNIIEKHPAAVDKEEVYENKDTETMEEEVDNGIKKKIKKLEREKQDDIYDIERIVPDLIYIRVLEESINRFREMPLIFFPYSRGASHNYHKTTVKIFKEQLEKMIDGFDEFFKKTSLKWEEERVIGPHHLWKYVDRREFDGIMRYLGKCDDKYNEIYELVKLIYDIAKTDWIKRRKQSEIIALARSFGITCYIDDDIGEAFIYGSNRYFWPHEHFEKLLDKAEDYIKEKYNPQIRELKEKLEEKDKS